jgi:putative transposase
LSESDSQQIWPAVSTAGDILRRAGLVNARLRRRRCPPTLHVLSQPLAPNDLWTADFKGQFRTGDRRYCYPLTSCDGATRYILGIRALTSTELQPVQQSFQRLFEEYGLPRRIRTDNGPPFAGSGLAHLSHLSLWWTRLSIEHERIAPAHPEQNGAHERMHQTLKAETARPPKGNRLRQQYRFNSFRREFNQLRPHEALGQIPPARVYRASSRRLPSKLPPIDYPGHFEVRSVRANGYFSWNGHYIYLSTVLGGQRVGMEEIDDGIHSLFFGTRLLARLDERTMQLREGAA